jgi:hypothetical protein
MPLLALNRKDTGWRIDWQEAPVAAVLASFALENASSVAVSWPDPYPANAASRNRGHIA